MQTPPIPPKSRHVELECVSPEHFELTFDNDHKGRNVFFTDDMAGDRLIVSCVAEVEWRKRAERWEKIFIINNAEHRARKPVGEHIKVTSYRRYRNWWLWDLSDKQRKICQDNALAWRAWGEQK